VLAPVLVNIIAFHGFLAPAGLPLPIILLALELFLAGSYRDAFAPMLRARTEPHTRTPASGRGQVPAHAS
jgi:hypothetical protein